MKTLFAVTVASIYGLSLRILFQVLENLMGIMSISFIVIAPMAIGFLTIYLIPKSKTKSAASAFFKPWISCIVILAITLSLGIEGSICWIMVFPLFAILAGIGGIIAYNLRNKDKVDSDDPNILNLSIVLLIPALFGLIEGDRTMNHKEIIITKSIDIEASPKAIWAELTNINKIPKSENKYSMSSLIGFPKHIETTLDTVSIGGKRKAIYENGLYFNETIAQMIPEKRLVLDIHTDPKNIPPTVMDEHIIIGGKHIDILQDIYTIEKIDNSHSRLTLSSKFFINTPFNWYAGLWANFLMSDILNSEIKLIQKRAHNTK